MAFGERESVIARDAPSTVRRAPRWRRATKLRCRSLPTRFQHHAADLHLGVVRSEAAHERGRGLRLARDVAHWQAEDAAASSDVAPLRPVAPSMPSNRPITPSITSPSACSPPSLTHRACRGPLSRLKLGRTVRHSERLDGHADRAGPGTDSQPYRPRGAAPRASVATSWHAGHAPTESPAPLRPRRGRAFRGKRRRYSGS